MNDEITNLWVQFLQNSLVVLSWGISKIKMTEHTLTFVVNGAYYKGDVSIECLEEKFDIYIHHAYINFPSVPLDDVVRVIDETIESKEYFNQK